MGYSESFAPGIHEHAHCYAAINATVCLPFTYLIPSLSSAPLRDLPSARTSRLLGMMLALYTWSCPWMIRADSAYLK